VVEERRLTGSVDADDYVSPHFTDYAIAPLGVPTTLTGHGFPNYGGIVFVAPDQWDLDCEYGREYSPEITAESYDCIPVEVMSWGSVKALYRTGGAR
jgi:hypothetical protein